MARSLCDIKRCDVGVEKILVVLRLSSVVFEHANFRLAFFNRWMALKPEKKHVHRLRDKKKAAKLSRHSTKPRDKLSIMFPFPEDEPGISPALLCFAFTACQCSNVAHATQTCIGLFSARHLGIPS